MSERRLIGTSVPDVDLTKSDAEMTRKERIAKEQATKNFSSQGVYDEKGRQRFHGAFTGGFSAGYYNTVGSKEGFTPKSYYSSRNERAAGIAQSITDFMDEEDLRDMDFGGRGGSRLQVASDFARRDGRGGAQGSHFGSAEEESLFVPFELIRHGPDTIGYRLLKVMGWREGRAVGPKRLALQEDDEKVFSSSDSKIERFQEKTNTFGLGYDPLNFASEFTTQKRANEALSLRSNRVSMSTNFSGRDENEDDLIYGTGKSSFASELVQDEEEEDGFALNLKPTRKVDSTRQKRENKKKSADFSEFPGFVRAGYAPLAIAYFPAPKVPPNFNPVHSLPSGLREHLEALKMNFSTNSALTASQRSQLLQEEVLKGPNNTTHSVRAGGVFVEAQKETKMPEFSLRSRFTSDPATSHPITSEQDKASLLFVPQSTQSSSNREKTVSSSHSVQVQDIMSKRFVGTQEKPSNDSNRDATELHHEAARSGAFGKLTRSIVEWTPTSLLCKRMSVFNPVRVSRHQPASSQARTTNLLTKESSAELSSPSFIASFSHSWRDQMQREESEVSIPKNSEDVSMVKINVSAEDRDDVNTPLPPIEKPPTSLFKSIFEDDEEDEDEPEIEEQEKNEIPRNFASTHTTRPQSTQTSFKSDVKSEFDVSEATDSFFARIAADLRSTPFQEPETRPISSTNDLNRIRSVLNPSSAPSRPLEGVREGPQLPPRISDDRDKQERDYKDKERDKDKHKHKHKDKDKHKHKDKDRSKSKKTKKRYRYSSDEYDSEDSREYKKTDKRYKY